MNIKTSCVQHPVKSRIVVIREDYLCITDNDHCQAALLAVMEYWTNWKLDEIERKVQKFEGVGKDTSIIEREPWIYKSIEQFMNDLMGLFGRTLVNRALIAARKAGFIRRRPNPQHGWDRTFQYLLDIEKIQQTISACEEKAAAAKADAAYEQTPMALVDPKVLDQLSAILGGNSARQQIQRFGVERCSAALEYLPGWVKYFTDKDGSIQGKSNVLIWILRENRGEAPEIPAPKAPAPEVPAPAKLTAQERRAAEAEVEAVRLAANGVTPQDVEAWDNVLIQLRGQMTEASFNKNFGGAKIIRRDKDQLIIQLNDHAVEWVNGRLQGMVARTAQVYKLSLRFEAAERRSL